MDKIVIAMWLCREDDNSMSINEFNSLVTRGKGTLKVPDIIALPSSGKFQTPFMIRQEIMTSTHKYAIKYIRQSDEEVISGDSDECIGCGS